MRYVLRGTPSTYRRARSRRARRTRRGQTRRSAAEHGPESFDWSAAVGPRGRSLQRGCHARPANPLSFAAAGSSPLTVASIAGRAHPSADPRLPQSPEPVAESRAVMLGILIVLGAIAGGFTLAGGHFPVLIQPSEFIVILGAAVGTLLTSSPGLMKKRVVHAIKA